MIGGCFSLLSPFPQIHRISRSPHKPLKTRPIKPEPAPKVNSEPQLFHGGHPNAPHHQRPHCQFDGRTGSLQRPTMWPEYACPHFGSNNNLLATCGREQDDPLPTERACPRGPRKTAPERPANPKATGQETPPRTQPHQPPGAGRAPRGRCGVLLDLPGVRRRSGKDCQQPNATVRQDTGRKASRVLSGFVIAHYLQHSRVMEDYFGHVDAFPAQAKAGRKPPKATTRPYTRHILGIDSGVQSHPKATPRPPQGYTKATPRLHQGYPQAKVEGRIQNAERSGTASPSHPQAANKPSAWG